MVKLKEKEELENLKNMPFKPQTSKFKGTQFDVSLAERSTRWTEMKKKKMKKKRDEIQQKENEVCSFKPKIVKLIFNCKMVIV